MVTLAILTVVVGLATVILRPRFAVRLLARASPQVLYFVDTDRAEVALTIDDGPDEMTTNRILNILERHRSTATFFLIGERARACRTIVARIVSDGHEVGNHLARDRPSIRQSSDAFERDLTSTQQILSEFGVVRWMRPGGGWFNDRICKTAHRHGLAVALGSIYPFDTAMPFSWFAAHYILWNVKAGAIIILHDVGARGRRTAATLERILPELKQRGFEVRALSEMAQRHPTAHAWGA